MGCRSWMGGCFFVGQELGTWIETSYADVECGGQKARRVCGVNGGRGRWRWRCRCCRVAPAYTALLSLVSHAAFCKPLAQIAPTFFGSFFLKSAEFSCCFLCPFSSLWDWFFAPSFRQPKIFPWTILVREKLCFALASFNSVRWDQEGAIIVVTGIRRRDVWIGGAGVKEHI